MQRVKCLPHKRGNLSLVIWNPQTARRGDVRSQLSNGERVGRDRLMLVGHPAWLMRQPKQETISHKTEGRANSQGGPLASTCVLCHKDSHM